MLEIIAGILIFLSISILATLVLTGILIFAGTVAGIDTDSMHEDDE
jgi:hypothetical protein